MGGYVEKCQCICRRACYDTGGEELWGNVVKEANRLMHLTIAFVPVYVYTADGYMIVDSQIK